MLLLDLLLLHESRSTSLSPVVILSSAFWNILLQTFNQVDHTANSMGQFIAYGTDRPK